MGLPSLPNPTWASTKTILQNSNDHYVNPWKPSWNVLDTSHYAYWFGLIRHGLHMAHDNILKHSKKSFNVFAKHVILWISLLEKKRDLLLTLQEWEKNYAFICLRHSHTWCLGLANNIILTPIKVSQFTIPQFLELQVINFLNIISTCPHIILISNYNWVIILKFAI
jgi:hypothetical protein